VVVVVVVIVGVVVGVGVVDLYLTSNWIFSYVISVTRNDHQMRLSCSWDNTSLHELDIVCYSVQLLDLSIWAMSIMWPQRRVSKSENFDDLNGRKTGPSQPIQRSRPVVSVPPRVSEDILRGMWKYLTGYVKLKKKIFYDKHWITRARFSVSHRRLGCKNNRLSGHNHINNW
jgi:hypothetical protein